MRWRVQNSNIYTSPKAAFLTCSYRGNLKPRFKNVALSLSRAAFLIVNTWLQTNLEAAS